MWYQSALVAGVVLWYLWYSLECWINGGGDGESNVGMVFRCFIQETLWILPGGRKRKGRFIRDLMHGFDDGVVGGYRFADIRSLDLYEECGESVLPGFRHWMFTHVFIPLIPLQVVFVCHVILSALMES